MCGTVIRHLYNFRCDLALEAQDPTDTVPSFAILLAVAPVLGFTPLDDPTVPSPEGRTARGHSEFIPISKG